VYQRLLRFRLSLDVRSPLGLALPGSIPSGSRQVFNELFPFDLPPFFVACICFDYVPSDR
jgi:hypothetical protein